MGGVVGLAARRHPNRYLGQRLSAVLHANKAISFGTKGRASLYREGEGGQSDAGQSGIRQLAMQPQGGSQEELLRSGELQCSGSYRTIIIIIIIIIIILILIIIIIIISSSSSS